MAEMNMFAAAMIADGEWDMAGFEPSEENFLAAYQFMVDNGTAWTLQGRIGRQAMALIQSEQINPPPGYVLTPQGKLAQKVPA
jgi:hypothetical protein